MCTYILNWSQRKQGAPVEPQALFPTAFRKRKAMINDAERRMEDAITQEKKYLASVSRKRKRRDREAVES